ncbi:hypothetical protein P5673_028650, partial [Acropora cervicornis]
GETRQVIRRLHRERIFAQNKKLHFKFCAYPPKPTKETLWAFMNKYYFCIKNIAFEDCHKNATNVERRNLERAFLISRASDEQKFCDGIDFKLSYPRNLRQNDCEKNYVEVKQACESSYVETYLKNKSDKSLC